MVVRERVASNLKRLRKTAGLSQEELAGRANVNRNYIGKLERRENSATTDMLAKLADVLGCDIVDLVSPVEKSRSGIGT
ncbi:helix-turn-helix domain-containing protein [Sphingosinicella rhizophila]|uniref:Helix-turn-helix transcriptional regulator n=1 Tax=Sphingosinicella rhizophila TaxID=3050082 RepID=A0ABU3Q5C3_9SPHN|nr:helix-turn-helix transcriptional regulator [Sphingosinicella sp. GR2756]MDT9598613.1 helix-turn-helix transcriptional regulator [Sphingosinicella sp. GR2756]